MSVFEPGRFFESEIFTLGDTSMAIQVYPNGYNEEYKGNVSIFLSNESDSDVNVTFHLLGRCQNSVVGPLSVIGS